MLKWYLRRRGDVLGPFTTDQMRAMRESGAFERFDEVSFDKKTWRPLADMAAMAAEADPPAGPVPVAEPEPPTPPDPAPRRRPLRLVGCLAGLVLIGLLVVAVLLALQQLPGTRP